MPRRSRGDLSPATLRSLGQHRRWNRRAAPVISAAVALGLDEAEETGGDRDALVLQAVREALAELPPRPLTAGQHRRGDRDALIALAARHGFTQRRLARFFGLSKSRIAAIATFHDRTEPAPIDPESDR